MLRKRNDIKILLVTPPVNRLCEVKVNYFPLGLGYLAAITNKAGYKTYIYNAELETRRLPKETNRLRIANHRLFKQALDNDSHHVWREFRAILKNLMPTIVGFSCSSASVMPCLKMAKEAKKICNSTIVFGGMHPTILPEETVRLENIDYIVAGDAEKSFLKLVESIIQDESQINIPGVGRYIDKNFYFTPPTSIEQNIDIFPFPDREALINMAKHKRFLQAIISSRGCPFRCTFCSGRNITNGVVRYRSVDSVIEEIKFLKKCYGMTHISFYDDALIISKNRIVQLCQELIRQNTKISWSGFARADSFDKELLALMKASGCNFLGIGVESGSDKILTKIKKGYTREEAISGVKLIKDSGINVAINIIIGFPFETAVDIKDSISLIRILDVPTNINTFTPYPKTELYDYCVKIGLIKQNMDWISVSQHSPYNEFINELSADEYRKLLEEMVSLADSIIKKRYRFRYIKSANRMLREDRYNPARFIKTVSQRAAGYIRQRFH